MGKLPPTSYIRMVDIWLINGQLVPFFEVILLTVLELLREGTSAINHHGVIRFRMLYALRVTFNFRNIDSTVGVQVGKNRKLIKYLKITEKKIFPIIFLIFTTIYWTYGMSLYF